MLSSCHRRTGQTTSLSTRVQATMDTVLHSPSATPLASKFRVVCASNHRRLVSPAPPVFLILEIHHKSTCSVVFLSESEKYEYIFLLIACFESRQSVSEGVPNSVSCAHDTATLSRLLAFLCAHPPSCTMFWPCSAHVCSSNGVLNHTPSLISCPLADQRSDQKGHRGTMPVRVPVSVSASIPTPLILPIVHCSLFCND